MFGPDRSGRRSSRRRASSSSSSPAVRRCSSSLFASSVRPSSVSSSRPQPVNPSVSLFAALVRSASGARGEEERQTDRRGSRVNKLVVNSKLTGWRHSTLCDGRSGGRSGGGGIANVELGRLLRTNVCDGRTDRPTVKSVRQTHGRRRRQSEGERACFECWWALSRFLSGHSSGLLSDYYHDKASRPPPSPPLPLCPSSPNLLPAAPVVAACVPRAEPLLVSPALCHAALHTSDIAVAS